jgi:hypothetical protein
MTRVASWALVLLLLGGLGAVAYRALAARVVAGKDLPPYSVYAADRNGLAGTAAWLRRLGWEPVAVTRPMQHLQGGDTPRLLILVEPKLPTTVFGTPGEMSDLDVKGLLRWVEQGNTLLLAGRTGTALHRELGVSLVGEAPADDAVPREVVLAEAGAYTDGVDDLAVEGADSVEAPAGLPLWWLGDRTGAALVPRGRGRVIVIGDPSLLTPRGLHRRDNYQLVYNLIALHARDGRVYFDEYHHGLRSGGGFWGYLAYQGQRWTLIPVLAAAAASGWALMVRLGPAVPAPPQARADAVDYASALARIYQRAGVRGRLARVLTRGFLTGLARHLRVRRNALPAELLAAWRQQNLDGAPTARLQELLRGATQLRQSDVSDRQLLAWSRAFDTFLEAERSHPAAAGRSA